MRSESIALGGNERNDRSSWRVGGMPELPGKSALSADRHRPALQPREGTHPYRCRLTAPRPAELHATPHRRAPLARRRHAFAHVLRPHALLLRADLELQRRRQRRPGRRVDQPLRQPDGDRRAAQQLVDERRARPASGRRGWPGRSARRRRRRSRAPVMISSFARPTPTICGSREEPPTSGHEAEPGLREPDDRVLGHHPQVAGQRELQRAAEADAVDHADGRLGHLLGRGSTRPGSRGGTTAAATPRRRPRPARRRPCRRRTPGRCRAGRPRARTGRRRPRAAPRRRPARARG